MSHRESATAAALRDGSAAERAPAPAVAAALFDWDGTLIDSRAALLGAWHDSTEAVLGRRYPATPEEEQIVFTLPGSQIWPTLAGDRRQLDALVDGFQAAYERSGERVSEFDGVTAMLAALRRAGVAIAVVTGKARRRYRLDATHAGIASLVDVAVCVEDAVAPKPDPAPLLGALERLGISASRSVMVGDTAVDVAAGLAAGSAVIGVTWGNGSEHDLRAAGATVLAERPEQVPEMILRGEPLNGAAS